MYNPSEMMRRGAQALVWATIKTETADFAARVTKARKQRKKAPDRAKHDADMALVATTWPR